MGTFLGSAESAESVVLEGCRPVLGFFFSFFPRAVVGVVGGGSIEMCVGFEVEGGVGEGFLREALIFFGEGCF